MKRTLVGLFILAGLGWAQPAKKVAMVLQVEGKVASNSAPVMTGQLWSSGDRIELGAGSRVTVLMLNQGERQEITGQGSLEVLPTALKLAGKCASKVLSSTQLRLALNGDNHRQIGGMVFRDSVAEVKNSVLDRVEIAPEGVQVSCPAGAGDPPQLKFYFLDHYAGPMFNANLQGLKLFEKTEPLGAAFSTQVSAQKQADRWVWQVPWPLEDVPKSYALEAFPTQEPKELQLYTRVYHSSPQDLSELTSARQKVAAWASREPSSPGPSLYLASLLEEKGELQNALEALQPALALKPRDPGLAQMKARILLDLGHYADAAQTLKAVQPE